jgi:spermidine/putrescine transport system ATP-binding protein
MTVGRNVGYGLEMAGVGKRDREARVAAALEMVRLANVDHRRPSELSGGQQQRVALARALINRPKALLLDEPLGALDLKLRKAMQFELKELNRETGSTFIYVTHDQEEALTMSDRIAVMNEGRILQLGTPAEIYENPADRFVADFIGQSNLLAGVLESVADGRGKVRIDVGDLIQTQVRGNPLPGDKVLVSVRPERIELVRPDRADSPDGLRGVVIEVVYLGSHNQIVLDIAGNLRLIVNAATDAGIQVSDQMVVRIPAQYATCFLA